MSSAHKLKVISLQSVLTPQRLEALRLYAAGENNRQIAARMGLSEKTVEYHLLRLTDATGLNRVELVLLAVARGILKNQFA